MTMPRNSVPAPASGDPSAPGVWSRAAPYYDRFLRATSSAEYARLHELVAEDLAGAAEVLDAATGTGELALLAAALPAHVTACDLAPEMIQVARRKTPPPEGQPIDWAVGDVCALAYPDDRFDAVVMANVLHLLPAPGRAVEQAQRVLRPGGALIAPTYCWGAGRIPRGQQAAMRLLGVRVHTRWSPEGYQQFLEASGFDVCRFEILPARPPLAYAVCVARRPD
jgi:ubiquinone/menaquinone biosynthesis C-methylase UbiE